MATPTGDTLCLPVVEASQVGEARRTAVSVAESVGFDERRRGEVAIVVTELATNLVRHARGGEVLLRPLGAGEAAGIEVLCVDRGPGIPSLDDALRDGFSTGGTPGTGLGAVRRLSTVFDAFTQAGAGTVILSRILADATHATPRDALDVGAVCLPVGGEQACGDAWAVEQAGHGRTLVLVADGLGHGLHAAEASRLAVGLFRENLRLDTARIVEVLHGGLRGTRGAAVAVAELRRNERELRFTGIGNIGARIFLGGEVRNLVSQNGTAGSAARRIQEFAYPWPPEALLVMHSDGLVSQWQLAKYPGLRFRHPALVAGVLYRDFRRERDDATVLVIGWGVRDGPEPT